MRTSYQTIFGLHQRVKLMDLGLVKDFNDVGRNTNHAIERLFVERVT